MKLNKTWETLLVLFLIALFGITPSIGALLRALTIHNNATIKAVGVAFYWDKTATQPLSNISWGLVEPGVTYYTTGYCKNIKTANITMTLAVSNWNPANAGLYMSPGWNYTGAIIQPNAMIPVRFYLQIYANITVITNFSFDYNVTATG